MCYTNIINLIIKKKKKKPKTKKKKITFHQHHHHNLHQHVILNIQHHKYEASMKNNDIGWFTLSTTYLGYACLILFGHLRDFFGHWTGKSRYSSELTSEERIVKGWERFYTRRLFNRIQDCWARPVCGRPSTRISLAERTSNDNQKTMITKFNHLAHPHVLNLGSYNYLGFADDDWKNTCGKVVFEGFEKFGMSCSSGLINEAGATSDMIQLEREIAEFVGKEDAVVFGTGYLTNLFAIKSIVVEKTLVFSDELNHRSIINGIRDSGVKVVGFKHNDANDLEKNIIENFIPHTSNYGKLFNIKYIYININESM